MKAAPDFSIFRLERACHRVDQHDMLVTGTQYLGRVYKVSRRTRLTFTRLCRSVGQNSYGCCGSTCNLCVHLPGLELVSSAGTRSYCERGSLPMINTFATLDDSLRGAGCTCARWLTRPPDRPTSRFIIDISKLCTREVDKLWRYR